jgi:hypothetical protein
MIVINTSDAIADLLPEVYYALDPDTPCIGELPATVRQCVRALIMRAFFHVLTEEFLHDPDWLARLRRDRFLSSLADRVWIDVDVVDTDGTYILTFEEGHSS